MITRKRFAVAMISVVPLMGINASAQVMGSGFGAYGVTGLGTVAGLPTKYGGLTFIDNNTVLIGGYSNLTTGALYTASVTRDGSNHITGFGSATRFGTAIGEYNDGGVAFGPGGVLFTARWGSSNGNNNVQTLQLGETKTGSTDEDKLIDLVSLGFPSNPAGLSTLNFVPTGFAGAGQLKMSTFNYSGGANDGQWWSASLQADGSGTYNLQNLARMDLDAASAGVQNITGGPEGFVYVHGGNAGFTVDSLIVSEWTTNRVSVYDIDANGDPISATRRTFMTGITGPEGAVIDPLTGDFLFSTFGTNSQLFRVSGFLAPVPEPATWALWLGGGATLLIARRRRQRPT